MPEFRRQLVAIAVGACFAAGANANPTGPSVAHGSASFATSGNTLTVTNTPGTIINWQQFSIRPDEVTRFIQSGAASAVLNRVTGTEHSAILGQLLSNGRVFLINPNGVTIGAGARIDTAGFVASSLAMSNEDFLGGRFRFTDPGNAGKVSNAGTIHSHSGGPVYLVAPTVENHGVINAPNGEVLLAAGRSVELVSAASPHLRVQVEAGGETLNVGQLVAESGRVGLYGAAIRNAGTISADSASVNAAGNVVLKASRDVTLEAASVVSASGANGGSVHVQAERGTLLAEGRIEATGSAGRGGDVKLLGEQVGLVGSARVDASGASGGGQVLVGGDYLGLNPGVQNAARTVLAPEARIVADATGRGDGGRVIVWSDEYTGFYGAISARGGTAGGNGGFVETSSKDNLQAFGTVDAAAPLGRAGQWLLDPSTVNIAAAADAGGAFGGGNPNIFTPTAATATANVATINSSLTAGTSVTINTASAAAGNGDINVNAAIAKTGGGPATLTLNAVRDVNLAAGISSTSGALNVIFNAGRSIANAGNDIATLGGNITMNAGGTGTITNLGTLTAGTGTITLNAPGIITQNAGDIIASTANLIKQGAGTMTLSQANTYTGTTDIQAGTVTVTNAGGLGTAAGGTTVAAGATLAINGTLTIADALTLNGTGVGGAGALQRVTAGNPTVTGAVTLASDAAVGGAGGTLTLSEVVGGPGGLTKVGAGTVVLSGANTYGGATNINAGTLTLGANDVLPDTTAVTVATGATLSVNNRIDTVGSIAGSGNITTTAGGVLTTGGNGASTTYSGVMSGAGGLTKIGAGTLTLAGANTYTGTTTINAGTLLYGANNALASGAVVVNDGGTYNLNGFSDTIGALTVNSGVAGGTVTTGAGTLTLGGNVTSTGGAANATISGNLSLGGATRTFTITDAADGLTVSAVVSGTVAGAGLTKAGAGTLTLANANTYTGTTTINGGTLLYGTNDALATGAVVVNDGGTYNLNGFSDTIGALTVNSGAIGGTVTTGAGTLTLGGNVTSTGGATNALITGNLNLGAAARTFTTTNAADGLTVSAAIGGTVGLTKAGTGTLTLSGANTYTGATTVSAGTLAAANAAALGTTAGGTTVAAGATLRIDNVAIGAEAVTLNGTGVGAAGALQGTGTASLAGNVTLNTASSVGVAAAGDALTLSGVVGGAVALTKVGAGTLRLSGANTYTGATNINAGTLVAANATALGGTGTGTTVAAGATLDIDNVAIGAETITLNGTLRGTGTASLTGNVALNAATAAINTATAADTLTLTGVVSGANALNKNGAGTLVLGGAANNTYTGVTNVNAGTLVAAKAVALGTTAGGTTVADGATLRIAGVAIGAENVTLNGNGVGGTGALQGTGTASLAGNVTLASASSIGAPAAADTLTLSGVVGGANDLTKVGAGTVVLAGAAANTYGGATSVNSGTLRVGAGTNKIPDASAVTVAGGATLDLNGFGETIGSLAGAGNVTLGAATLTTGGNNATTTFSGVMSGAGGLVKQGSGAMTLAGANTYGGATNVNAGTLVAANATALGGTGSGTTVATGATLAIDNVAIGAENVTINGNGVGGAGALAGVGTALLGGAVTVASASRIGAGAGSSLALGGTVNGANALDVAGGGTVTFGGAVGIATALASLTTAAGTAVNINGGSVRTTGTQTYNGPVATGGATTLQTTNAAVVAAVAVNATAGTLTLNTGTGAVTMTNAANDFATVTIPSAGAVSLVDQNALALGASNVSSLQAQTLAGNLTLNGPITASGAGSSIMLAAAGNFVNTAGAAALNPGAGRWLVYSTDPAANAFGGLASGNQALWGRAYPAAVPEAGNRYVFTTQPTITFTSTDVAKTYGQDATAAVAAAYTVGGFVNAALYGSVFTQDTALNALSGAPSVTSLGSPGTAPVAGSPYAITVNTAGVTSPTGYAIAGNSAGLLTVNPAALTVTANDQAKTYGQTITFTGSEFTASGLQNGETIGAVTLASAGAAPTASVAGSPYAIAASNATGGTFNPGNYTITYNNGVLTVAPAALSVTAGNQTKTYGQTFVFNGTEFTSSGLQNGETIGSVTLASPGAAATAGVAGSPYAINASNATGGTFNPGNYTISYNGGLMTVNPAALTVTANDQAKTYGQTITFTGTEFVAGGLQNGETIGSVTLASAGAPATASVAGSPYAITASAATGGTFNPANYSITYNNGVLTVAPAALTVTASNQAKTYGQTVVFAGTEFSAAGLQNGETIGSVTLASAGAAPTASVAGSPYAITASNATGGTFNAANYTITYANGVLTVSPAALTVTPDNQTKVYGQTFVFNGTEFTSSGLQNGETIGSVALASAGAAPTAGVPGSPYAITGSNATGGTFNPGNYAITYANGSLTVTPLPIAVTANNQSKVYGQPDPALTFTAPTVNGDVLSGALARAPGETVAGGPYAITQGTVTDANNPNYLITFINGQLAITPAPLTITANDATRAVGQPNPPFSATATGLQLGDTLASLNGVMLITSPATTASPAGAYPITPSGVSSSNYTITFVDGTLVVTPGAPPTPPTPPQGAAPITGDQALVTALQRSAEDLPDSVRPILPRALDCLLLERQGERRVLGRCY